jgi:multidrug efflux system membrane fusion protein
MLLTQRASGWRRKPTWRAAVWIVLALLVAGGIAFWIATRPTVTPRGGRSAATGPMAVVAATAEPGSIDITINGLGTVTPLATVTVKTQIAGRLMRIAFTEGQMVRRGDLLAQIDSRPFEFALAQMQGQLARDQALLRSAELDLNRFQTLLKQDSIARQQVDTQESLVRQLRGTVQSDQAMVDNAKLNIEYTQIVAPMDGRVGLRQVDEGNYVQLNDTNGIVVITQLQPITALFSVPEDQLPVIMSRLREGATLTVTAWDRARKNKLATGALVAADNVIDTTTGTVRLRARFDNQSGELYPNQFVNVQLLVNTVQDAIVIPTAAVQRGAPGTFVYVIKPDETVTVRPVQLGPSEGERAAVQSGLQSGEKVVVDGADKLRDGAKVSLRDRTGAAAGTAPADSGQAQRRRRNTQ